MGRKKRCAYWMKPMRMPMVTVPKKPETRAGCRPNAAAAWRKALLCRTASPRISVAALPEGIDAADGARQSVLRAVEVDGSRLAVIRADDSQVRALFGRK